MVKHAFVNISFGLLVVFLVFSCQQPNKHDETGQKVGAEPSIKTNLDLQIIWGSRLLDKPVENVALSNGEAKYVLIQYEDGALQVLDFELERLSDAKAAKPADIVNGVDFTLTEESVVVFLGRSETVLKAHIYAPSLNLFEVVDVNGFVSSPLVGFCAAQGERKDYIRAAVWTATEPTFLQIGEIDVLDQKLTFHPKRTKQHVEKIKACAIDGDEVKAMSEASSYINSPFGGQIALKDGLLVNPDTKTPLTIGSGLSLILPDQITAIASRIASVDPTLPYGVIAIAGTYSDSGKSRVLFLGQELADDAEYIP